jgi:hypothetical protein
MDIDKTEITTFSTAAFLRISERGSWTVRAEAWVAPRSAEECGRRDEQTEEIRRRRA